MLTCRICANAEGNTRFVAREMMYGRRDEFAYFECARCGCVQIEAVPANLADYYPEDYYSFSEIKAEHPLKQYLIRKRAAHLRGGTTLAGRLYNRRFPAPPVPDWLRPAGLSLTDHVLEVGSGLGHRLWHLSYSGFSHLTGIDPYIRQDVHYPNGVAVLRRTLPEVEGLYDFIMLHHALEHMPEQLDTFGQLRRLLRPGKMLLLRIPVAGGHAWRKYGSDWVQLDAPRHLFLHTERSIAVLARQTGFAVEQVSYDSTGFQFWGSEQYRRGVPLVAPGAAEIKPRSNLFTAEELQEFEAEARRLNEARQGDQACFYLRKV